MSNGERNGKFKIIAVVVGILLAAGAILFFSLGRGEELHHEFLSIPFESFDISYTKDGGVSFSAVAKKEDIEELFKEKGAIASAILRILPQEVKLSGNAGLTDSEGFGNVSLRFLEMSVNGLKLPNKLLEEIGEISLDFKRSLVYN